MNFNVMFTHSVYKIISLLVGLIFVLLGIVGICLSLSNTVQEHVVNFFEQKPVLVFLFSACFLLSGIGIVIFFFYQKSSGFYRLTLHSQLIDIDNEIFTSYLRLYWQEKYPSASVPFQTFFRNNQLTLQAELPYKPLENQKSEIQQIEKELGSLLSQKLGYKGSYTLYLDFNAQPTAK